MIKRKIPIIYIHIITHYTRIRCRGSNDVCRGSNASTLNDKRLLVLKRTTYHKYNGHIK